MAWPTRSKSIKIRIRMKDKDFLEKLRLVDLNDKKEDFLDKWALLRNQH